MRHERRVYQINDDWKNHSWTKEGWFEKSIKVFRDKAPSTDIDDYDYVQIVPQCSYYRYWCGNDGTQAFRHRDTGWTFPDYCRQQGGCPEMWYRSRRRQMDVSQDSPVLAYIVEW